MDFINVPLSNQGYAGLATQTQPERYSLNAQLANQRQALATIITSLDGIEASLFGCGPQTCSTENASMGDLLRASFAAAAKNPQPDSIEQIVGAMANQIEKIHGMIARISNRL